ncbi:hypothetical protein BGZ99_001215 [Dissophora globulifera]|uniref:Protein kinase domain-containing protein n=1 Tax=Dissophora globulifera TaxID=979702 RepID=A0A9P6RXY6_9FUNG|nr:hypothetical protein BGZ99_001215 [Dissophora globulifera]
MGSLLSKCISEDTDRRKDQSKNQATSSSTLPLPSLQPAHSRDIQLYQVAPLKQQKEQQLRSYERYQYQDDRHNQQPNPPQPDYYQRQPASAAVSAPVQALAPTPPTKLVSTRYPLRIDGDTILAKGARQWDKKEKYSESTVPIPRYSTRIHFNIQDYYNNINNNNNSSKSSPSPFRPPTSTPAYNTFTPSPNSSIQLFSSDRSYSTTATTLNAGQSRSLSVTQGLDRLPFPLSSVESKALLSSEIPGSEIDKLSIGVDAGGMGIIHVAEWRGVKVAIKEACANVIAKEVQIYNRMRGCEGVVKFFGVTYPPGLDKLCIVTKYAESGSLSWHLKVSFNKLTWSDKLRLGTQIASSVARLHKEGIYHRDLHGGNILIDEDGKAMLTDFGASTVMEERVVRSIDEFAIATSTTPEGKSRFVSRITGGIGGFGSSSRDYNSSGLNASQQGGDEDAYDPLIGVMAYIAPERFRNPRYFDAKCDIYSLGVLLWELTSGHAAFARMPQDVQLAVSILNGKREQAIDGTPARYQELYERCWESDPNMRPSLDEILLTLEDVRADLSDEQLSVTRERNIVHHDSGGEYEESLSVPRPTSDYQQYLLSE